jgi:hypothetical protein
VRNIYLILLITGLNYQSCKNKNIQPDEGSSSVPTNKTVFDGRIIKSEIVSATFDQELLYGIWTVSNTDPTCAFEITEKIFLYCDYDGNGERQYKVYKDSIYLYDSTLIYRGSIISVSKDSLVIKWEDRESPDILLRWQE